MNSVRDNVEIQVHGRLVRIAKLKNEYYEHLLNPNRFLDEAIQSHLKADVFTFLQNVIDTEPHHDYHLEWTSLAVLKISTYGQWWKTQINDKTRNMIRRASKSGIQIRVADFKDDFIKGVKSIYDESPLRQGKPFKHYGKDLDTLKREHATFLERSVFIGAYDSDELIGFIKLVHGNGYSSLMQIISKISYRAKAPTNALIAKAVEICCENNIHYLHYGIMSRRGLGEFKKHHAFERHDVPRYFVPLTIWGRVVLGLGLHRPFQDRLPEQWASFGSKLIEKWNHIKLMSHRSPRTL